MKKLVSIFALLAFFTISASTVFGQGLEFGNKSECTISVSVTVFDANCNVVCTGGPTIIAGESEATITPTGCGVFIPALGYSVAVEVTDGTTVTTVGSGCGFNSTANYDDCNNVNRTLELYGHQAAVVY